MLNELASIITNPYLVIIFLTLIPFLELRASIPYGILATDLSWYTIMILAIIANILLAPVLYFFLDKIIHLFFFIKPFEKWYHNKLEKTQKRAQPIVNKYGLLGVAIFISIPLPGSGVYTGALISYIFNLGYKRFFYAAIIGVTIAAIAVTIITFTADIGGSFIARLFLKV